MHLTWFDLIWLDSTWFDLIRIDLTRFESLKILSPCFDSLLFWSKRLIASVRFWSLLIISSRFKSLLPDSAFYSLFQVTSAHSRSVWVDFTHNLYPNGFSLFWGFSLYYNGFSIHFHMSLTCFHSLLTASTPHSSRLFASYSSTLFLIPTCQNSISLTFTHFCLLSKPPFTCILQLRFHNLCHSLSNSFPRSKTHHLS